MGYSYAAKAGYTLDAIRDAIGAKCSNGMPDGGFWETGREQADGAITGTVWRACGPEQVTRGGSFRIEACGRVARFPGLARCVLRAAELEGAKRYRGTHGTWRERGAVMLEALRAGKIDPLLSYSWFESIFRAWQSEARIMFAVMPAAESAAMAATLAGMLILENQPNG